MCERYIHRLPSGDQTCSSDMGPDRKSNPRPFSSQDDAQPTESHQPGLTSSSFKVIDTDLEIEVFSLCSSS